jgi:hypothetical protein
LNLQFHKSIGAAANYARKAEYGFDEKEDRDGRPFNWRVMFMNKIPNSGLYPVGIPEISMLDHTRRGCL